MKIITNHCLNTPASNLVINAWTDPNGLGNRSQNPRWAENPDNPKIQSAILDWYHFYVDLDAVAGTASGVYELSNTHYDNSGASGDYVKNFKVSAKNIPIGRGHFWPTENSEAIKSAWEKGPPYTERQRDSTYEKE